MRCPVAILIWSLAIPALAVDCSPPGPALAFEIVARKPHDTTAFTQGLIWHQGLLYESTGGYGRSELRAVDPASGAVWRREKLSRHLFGEGLALFQDQLWQLTWKAGQALAYRLPDLAPVATRSYGGQGWGLTADASHLIISDGSHRLRFVRASDFSTVRELPVHAAGKPVRLLNELEYVGGHIYANIWQSDRVARIDAATGCVTGWLDFAGLLPPAERKPPVDVLNGIAYDAAREIFYITGKRWPTMFLIRLTPEPGPAP